MRALLLLLVVGCGSAPEAAPSPPPEEVAVDLPPEPVDFALAVHGGAGGVPANAERRAVQVSSLRAVLAEGCAALDAGADSVDVVEQVVRTLEDDPLFNAGVGAVLTREGRHELDASIMRGSDLACGAVASVTTVANPISAARAVMDYSPHVLLVGPGAERFAEEQGLEPVDNSHFTTERRKEALQRRLSEEGGGTVGAAALDREGHLAAATSTGGLTTKPWGRVGDSPIIGAGTWADDRTVAVSATGRGEEFIRHAVAHTLADRVLLLGDSPQAAADEVIQGVLQPGDGGVIVVSSRGEVAFSYSTRAMLRGRCTAEEDVEVWVEEAPD